MKKHLVLIFLSPSKFATDQYLFEKVVFQLLNLCSSCILYTEQEESETCFHKYLIKIAL